MIRKAYAYITRSDELLVFRHVDYPEAGIQIPGGSVEAGETPEAGALRESVEETGLTSLRVVRFLGESFYEGIFNGKQVTHHRHFYHLIADGDVPLRWLAGEQNPSDGTMAKVFECYWVPFAAVPPLIAQMDTFLAEIVGEQRNF